MENQGPTGGLTPHIAIADKRASEAIEFYKQAFGAVEQVRMPAEDGVRLMHAHLHINGSSLMMHDDFPEYSGQSMAAPSGVTVTRRVVRFSSLVRRWVSSVWINRVTVALGRSNESAAFVKVPASTTRTKACIAERRSMGERRAGKAPELAGML